MTGLTARVVDLLPPHAVDLLAVLVPVGVTLLALLAVAAVARSDGERRERARAGVAWLLVVGLLVAAVTGVSAPPFVDLHLYSRAGPEWVVLADLRVVAADGTELGYDTRAIPPYTGAAGNWPARRLAEGDWAERRALGEFLLSRANAHRERVVAGGPGRVVDSLAFPRHVLDDGWRRADLVGRGPFVALRVYRVEVHYAPDGRRVASRCERPVLELRDSAVGPTAVDAGGTTVCDPAPATRVAVSAAGATS